MWVVACVGERQGKGRGAGVKRGDRAVFTPQSTKNIFFQKHFSKIFCDRRWTADWVGQVPSLLSSPLKRFRPFPNVPLHFSRNYKNLTSTNATHAYRLSLDCHRTESVQYSVQYTRYIYISVQLLLSCRKKVETFM